LEQFIQHFGSDTANPEIRILLRTNLECAFQRI